MTSPRFTVEDLRGPSNRLSQWRRLPRLIGDALQLVWRAGARQTATVTVLQLVSAGALAVQLLVGRRVLQEFLALDSGPGGIGAIVPELAILVGVTVLMGAIGAVAMHQQGLLSELVARETWDKIIEIASDVELALFEDPEFYDELARAKTSGLNRPLEIVNGLSVLVTAVLASAGIGVALLTMHSLLLPLVILGGIPVLLATLHNSRESYQFEYLWTPRNRERAYLMQLLTERRTAQELRVFSATRFLRQRYDALTEERLSRLRDYLRRRLRVGLAGTLGGSVGAAIALGSLVWLVVSGRIDVATAMTAGVAIQLLISRFNAVSRGIGSLVQAGMFLDDYQSFLRYGRGLSTGRGKIEPTVRRPFQHVAIEHVSFAYPGTSQPVLHDVSLEIGRGEVVALVGANGSGKTTLVKILCQLYRPDEGRVVWNGSDTRELDPEELRSEITVIFQNYIQYHLSVLENIALGRADRVPDAAAIREAALQAGAHDFIARLPLGYDTRLGREFYGGHELSVGQWQRLALARAFFRSGSFLILDEPTASLDPRAEHDLFTQIRTLTQECSVLLISHRFSSVRSADRIYVLDSGRIIEAGTHDELLSRGGHYAELFTLQANAFLGERSTRGALL